MAVSPVLVRANEPECLGLVFHSIPRGGRGGIRGSSFLSRCPAGAFRVAKTSDRVRDQRSGSHAPRRGLARRLCRSRSDRREKAQKVESPPCCSGGAAQRRIPRPKGRWAVLSAPWGVPLALVCAAHGRGLARSRTAGAVPLGEGWKPEGPRPAGGSGVADSPARAGAGHPRAVPVGLQKLARKTQQSSMKHTRKPPESQRNPTKLMQESITKLVSFQLGNSQVSDWKAARKKEKTRIFHPPIELVFVWNPVAFKGRADLRPQGRPRARAVLQGRSAPLLSVGWDQLLSWVAPA